MLIMDENCGRNKFGFKLYYYFYYSMWSYNKENYNSRIIIIGCVFCWSWSNFYLSLFIVFKVVSMWVVGIEDLR